MLSNSASQSKTTIRREPHPNIRSSQTPTLFVPPIINSQFNPENNVRQQDDPTNRNCAFPVRPKSANLSSKVRRPTAGVAAHITSNNTSTHQRVRNMDREEQQLQDDVKNLRRHLHLPQRSSSSGGDLEGSDHELDLCEFSEGDTEGLIDKALLVSKYSTTIKYLYFSISNSFK